MAKKESNDKNHGAAEAWAKRKHNHNAANTQHQWFQKEYRKSCLRARVAAGRLTDKNKVEMSRLGM